MDDYSVPAPNFIYVLLTTVEYESYYRFAGLYNCPQKAIAEANNFARNGDDAEAHVVRIDPTETFEMYFHDLSRLPMGTCLVYQISGKVMAAE